MSGKLTIEKHDLRGEDGYKTFSIRIKKELAERLDALSSESGRSRNELIGLMIEYGLENCEVI